MTEITLRTQGVANAQALVDCLSGRDGIHWRWSSKDNAWHEVYVSGWTGTPYSLLMHVRDCLPDRRITCAQAKSKRKA